MSYAGRTYDGGPLTGKKTPGIGFALTPTSLARMARPWLAQLPGPAPGAEAVALLSRMQKGTAATTWQIPGYTGFIPGRYADNVMGTTFAKGVWALLRLLYWLSLRMADWF